VENIPPETLPTIYYENTQPTYIPTAYIWKRSILHIPAGILLHLQTNTIEKLCAWFGVTNESRHGRKHCILYSIPNLVLLTYSYHYPLHLSSISCLYITTGSLFQWYMLRRFPDLRMKSERHHSCQGGRISIFHLVVRA
jgi:hypothetical protein